MATDLASLALSAIQTLFAALQCKQFQDFCVTLNYKSQLKDLEKTVSTVQKILKGADLMEGQLSPEEEDYIQELTEAVYDADDLFDEVLTLSELSKDKKRGKLAKKVRRIFSPIIQLSVAHNVSKQIKLVRKQLEDTANNHQKFALKFDTQPIRKRKLESYSCLNGIEVIGRESETEIIVDRLLQSDVFKDDVGFLSIVGVGGLGKTTLAQLVYKNERIVKEFSGSTYWVCVSDHVKASFDVKAILSKIIERVNCQKPGDGSPMEMVQSQFQKELGGKKCLLILDDIWNEDRPLWIELRGFLMRLGRGSRILVTTRSRETATIIEYGNTTIPYELSGLSPENSWRLFALMAFGSYQEQDIPTDFVEIGHKIVEKCCCVPLALKVVGSLLLGQERSKWDAFENREVARVKNGDNDIMFALKFSYLSLDPPLKCCFKYCAIFPKDFEMEKEILIRLWKDLGYIVPSEEGESSEDVGEAYFSVLLKRCFFQGVVMDKFGGVWSCKIHDLMHDVAEEVARNEIWRSDYKSDKVRENVRHVSHHRNSEITCSPSSSKIRSCINYRSFEAEGSLVDNWKRLRVLKLHEPDMKVLKSIGNLLHLRSLDLSTSCLASNRRYLSALPESITKLQNLQTLNLCNLWDLRALPKGLKKLKRLEHLNIRGCNKLTHMPSGMDKLTCLTSLSKFIVNEDSSGSEHVGKLKDLKMLTKLSNKSIAINIRRYINNSNTKEEEHYLKRLKNLWIIHIIFEECDKMRTSDYEALMDKLEPHPNLKQLCIECYKGWGIQSWGRAVDDWSTTLPGLVEIHLKKCRRLQKLPLLSRLCCLKKLVVDGLDDLEYMEDSNTATNAAISSDSIFFPSLVYLQITHLANLKEWWSNHKLEHYFPCLLTLQIEDCPNFAFVSCCPNLEYLHLVDYNEALRISSGDDNNINPTQDGKLKEVVIGKLNFLRSMYMENVTSITIRCREEMVNTCQDGEIFKRASSLRNLEFVECSKVTSIYEWFEHLSLLESLSVIGCRELRFDDESQHWRSLGHTLRFLRLRDIPKPVSLPKGLCYLTSLQNLIIFELPNLESVPEWISSLSSLTYLQITRCPKIKSLPEAMSKLTSLDELYIRKCGKELKERCQQDPPGDDWPKIRHVPNFFCV